MFSILDFIACSYAIPAAHDSNSLLVHLDNTNHCHKCNTKKTSMGRRYKYHNMLIYIYCTLYIQYVLELKWWWSLHASRTHMTVNHGSMKFWDHLRDTYNLLRCYCYWLCTTCKVWPRLILQVKFYKQFFCLYRKSSWWGCNFDASTKPEGVIGWMVYRSKLNYWLPFCIQLYSETSLSSHLSSKATSL